MDLNGKAPAPATSGALTTCWRLERTPEGRKKFIVRAIYTPLLQAVNSQIDQSRPRMAGAPVVVGDAELDVPNLEILKILHMGIGEMLAKQPPEIMKPDGSVA
jgi:hypothetical protein